MTSLPQHFHLLAKPTGAVCNLDCKYCFFLSKELLYPGSRFRMADDLLQTYIRQLLESQPGPAVIVSWQGGEPTLMGLAFYGWECLKRHGVDVNILCTVNAANGDHSVEVLEGNQVTLDDRDELDERRLQFIAEDAIDTTAMSTPATTSSSRSTCSATSSRHTCWSS